MALLVAVGVAGCGDGSSGGSTDDITFGMVTDTSGPSAAYSKITAQGVKDAVKELNANGGVLGKHVDLVTADDGSDPSKSPTTTRHLISEGAQVLLLTSGSGAVMADKSAVQRAQVPSIAPTSIATQVSGPPDNDYVYTLANATSDLGKVYDAAFKKLGADRLAVFSDNSPTTAANVETLTQSFKSNGIDITTVEKAAPDADDVTAEVSRIKKTNPDAVIAVDEGGQLEALFWNTVHKLMPDVAKFTIPTIGGQPQAWHLADQSALDGVVFASSVTEDNKRTRQLEELFTKYNGSDYQFSLYAAQGYDAVQLLAKAITNAGGTDPDDVNAALQSITRYAASFGQPGATLSFGSNKHAGADKLCGLTLVEFKNNKPGPLWDQYQPAC